MHRELETGIFIVSTDCIRERLQTYNQCLLYSETVLYHSLRSSPIPEVNIGIEGCN